MGWGPNQSQYNTVLIQPIEKDSLFYYIHVPFLFLCTFTYLSLFMISADTDAGGGGGGCPGILQGGGGKLFAKVGLTDK